MHFQRNLISTLLIVSLLEAAPEGFTLIDGSAMPPISNGKITTIESGAKAIIDWNRFSVGAGEIVEFNQLNHNSSVLNRVTGSEMSEIFGQIQSNGMVYLLNPHGVLIGAEGQILTSGFIASTLDVLNADFMAGKDLVFAGNAEGQIYNMGTIRCPFGDAVLIGRVVRNEGTISAPNGVGGLAASVEVLVKQSGNARIFVQAAEDSSVFVEQAGTIEAMSAEIRTGYSPYTKGINHTGITEATSIAHEGGRIYLVAEGGVSSVAGSIKATRGNGCGGEIQILGKEVGLAAKARVDVSGDFGGGTALIGGDYQGSNQEILNARNTYVDKEALIASNANIAGDGGKVVVWADGANGFYGKVDARGGSESGNGGFVEISGKELLDFRGFADRTAPRGLPGMLFLDPNNITVTGIVDDPNVNFGACGGGPHCGVSLNTYCVSAVDAAPFIASMTSANSLQTNLAAGPVTIATSSSLFDNGQPGIVTFASSVTWATANLLTVCADQQIIFNPGVVISNTSASAVPVMNFQAIGTTVGATYTGIDINNANITSVNGGISMTGIGGDMGSGNIGIRIASNGVSGFVQSVGGTISLTGTSSKVGTGTQNNFGILIDGGGAAGVDNVRSTSGSVTLLGTSHADGTMPFNVGVVVRARGRVVSDGIAPITITGFGGSGSRDDYGIWIRDSFSEVVSTATGSGAIILTGNAGTGASDCVGVRIDSAVSPNFCGINSQGSSTITVTGNASGTASDCDGILLNLSGARITSVSGNIHLIGTGSNTAAGLIIQHGIAITDGAFISSTGTGMSAADILLEGTSGTSSGNTIVGVGVRFMSGAFNSTVSTIDGDITFTGTSNGGGSTQRGVICDIGGTVISTGAGNINMTGLVTGGTTGNIGVAFQQGFLTSSGTGTTIIHGTCNATSDFSHGVLINNSSILQSTSTALMSITGIGGTGAGSSSNGVWIDNFSQVTTSQSSVAITGTSRATGGSDHGIQVSNSSLVRTTAPTVGGFLTFLGNCTGAASNSHGVVVQTSGLVDSTMAGPINITGTGASGATDSYGVSVGPTGIGTISSVNGAITVIGQGGSTTRGYGVRVSGTAPGSNITGSGTATVMINGTGRAGTSQGVGVGVDSRGSITATNGIMTVTGNGGLGSASSNIGVLIDGAIGSATVTQAGTAAMNIIGVGGTATASSNFGVQLINNGTIQSTSNSAPISVTGTTGSATTSAVFLTRGGNITSTLNSPITVTTVTGDCLLQDNGLISAVGSGLITMNINNDLILAANVAASGSAAIRNTTGNISLTVGRDLSLFVGAFAGGNQFAQIGNGVVAASGSILSPSIGRDVIVFGGRDNGWAVIGHGNPLMGVSPLSGDILFSSIGRNVQVLGATGGPGDFYGSGQIGHMDEVSQATVMSGNISLNVTGSVTVEGGGVATTFGGQYALIGHGGSSQSGSTVSAGNISFPNIGGGLNVIGGLGSGLSSPPYSQIGHSTTNAVGNITFSSIGGTGITLDGFSTAQYAVIGHGRVATGLTALSGLISFGTINGNLTVQGAVNPGGVVGFAQIGHIDSFFTPATLSGDLIFTTITGNLNLNGGTSAGTPYAIIGHGGQRGTTVVTSSNISFNTIGNSVNINGGTVAGGFSQVGHNAIDATGNITFSNVGVNVNFAQNSLATFSLIGHGDPTLSLTSNIGNISLTLVNNDIIMSSATAGAGMQGLSQVGHVAAAGAGATLSGDIFGYVRDSMFFNGGTAAATAYARVGHSGQGGSTVGPSNILLIADHNISLSTTGPGIAQIINESTTPNHCNVTLVTDNEFPAPPGIGPYGFFFSQNSLLTANTPNLGFTGELRIYTARLNQNVVNAILQPHLLGFPINGQTIVFPPEGVDDQYNQFCFYYPNGPYFGPEFVIYYKTPCPPGTIGISVPSLIDSIIDAQVANSQLSYLLPFDLPTYAFKICPCTADYWRDEENLFPNPCIFPKWHEWIECTPWFEQFESFIFENRVK